MAVRWLLYLAALGGSLVFFTAYQEWLAWLILLIVLILPWLSLLLSLPGMLTFRLEARGPAAVRLNGPAVLRLVGVSRFPVPPFRGRLKIDRVTTGEKWTLPSDTDLPTEHCGGLHIVPQGTWVYDYLGLFALPVRKLPRKTVLIRPEPVPIPVLPELDRFLARSWRPKPGGGFAENHELRLYRPGDSLNQVHWKLTAKTGKLILREPMEPERGLVLLTMNLRGSPAELDRKFGRLLWLGNLLLEKNVAFTLRVLTGEGIQTCPIATEQELQNALDSLLCAPPAREGDLRDKPQAASWCCHVGGDADEA